MKKNLTEIAKMLKNQIFYGDSLDVLQKYIAEESVDLYYIDPPFNSDEVYNQTYSTKHQKYDKLQIITVQEVLDGKRLSLPLAIEVLKSAERKISTNEQTTIF